MTLSISAVRYYYYYSGGYALFIAVELRKFLGAYINTGAPIVN